MLAPVEFKPPPIEFAPALPPQPPPRFVWLERLAITAVSIALALVVILLVSGYFSSTDPALVIGSANQYGRSYPDQGDARLAPGAPHPRYDSSPPTSGPHVPMPVTRDFAPLSVDQLLSALAAGDVVIEYPGGPSTPPPHRLLALADRLAGPFSPALAAVGDAVILTPHSGIAGLLALAWTRSARVSATNQPLLAEFIAGWLGRGASPG